jgi:phenylacetate-CoA ligase
MGVQPKTIEHAVELFNHLEKSQWSHKPNFKIIEGLPIITRDVLRKTKMKKGVHTSKTSGSTGEPLSVEKTYMDYVWYMSTNIREFFWRKWDFTKTIAVINVNMTKIDYPSWGIPYQLALIQGKKYCIGYEPISVLQKWLESKNPHYIQAAPSIIAQLDLTKISNYIDHKGSGELGGSMYSSEECGTIAIQCPDNPEVMHVMENQIVEVDTDGGIVITSLSNPYIRRYKHGDHIEMGECSCGRTLQTIKKIHGRVRNMFIMPNGDKKWPMIGSKEYYEKFGIKRYKAVQTDLDTLELSIICEPLGDREEELKMLVQKWIESPINVIIKYVDDFPQYKFEEFVSLVK